MIKCIRLMNSVNGIFQMLHYRTILKKWSIEKCKSFRIKSNLAKIEESQEQMRTTYRIWRSSSMTLWTSLWIRNLILSNKVMGMGNKWTMTTNCIKMNQMISQPNMINLKNMRKTNRRNCSKKFRSIWHQVLPNLQDQREYRMK